MRRKIGQEKRSTRQLNSILWNEGITRKTKTAIYKTIVEGISTYESEKWALILQDKNRLQALEMDFCRRSSRISRMDHVTKDLIREAKNVQGMIGSQK